MNNRDGIQAIEPTPAMRRYYEDLGYNERLCLNRLWEIEEPGFDPGRLEAALRKLETIAPDLTLRADIRSKKIRTLTVGEGRAFDFRVVDLSGLKDFGAAVEDECLAAQKTRLLDGKTPLFLVSVLKSKTGSLVHLCLNHITLDDRGVSLMVRALNNCYQDPDGAMSGPKSRLAQWSTVINDLGRRSAATLPEPMALLPRYESTSIELEEQARAEENWGGYYTDSAVRTFYTGWTGDEAPEEAARSMRALMSAMSVETTGLLREIRTLAGVEFDVITQAIAQAARNCFDVRRLHLDIDRSLRVSDLGDTSDGMFMVNELVPQLVEALERPELHDLRAQKAERRNGTIDWLGWKARRGQLMAAGEPEIVSELLPAPDIVVNFRAESDRSSGNFLNSKRSGLFIGENHNIGREVIPLGFWLQINQSGGRIVIIMEWQPHVANHDLAKRFMGEIIAEADRLAKRIAADLRTMTK